MEITAIVVVGFVTYIAAEIRKTVVISDHLIPIQNLIIGIIAAVLVIVFKLEDWNVLETFIYCILGSTSAGGVYEVQKSILGAR